LGTSVAPTLSSLLEQCLILCHAHDECVIHQAIAQLVGGKEQVLGQSGLHILRWGWLRGIPKEAVDLPPQRLDPSQRRANDPAGPA